MRLRYRQARYPWIAQLTRFVPSLLEAAWYFQGVRVSRQQQWPQSRHCPCFFLQPVTATRAQRLPLPPLGHCEGCTGLGSRSKGHSIGLWSHFLPSLLFWAASCPGRGLSANRSPRNSSRTHPRRVLCWSESLGRRSPEGRMLSSAVPGELCLGKEEASWNSPRRKSCRSTAACSKEGCFPTPRASACLCLFPMTGVPKAWAPPDRQRISSGKPE